METIKNKYENHTLDELKSMVTIRKQIIKLSNMLDKPSPEQLKTKHENELKVLYMEEIINERN